jgi:hypothetical protein
MSISTLEPRCGRPRPDLTIGNATSSRNRPSRRTRPNVVSPSWTRPRRPRLSRKGTGGILGDVTAACSLVELNVPIRLTKDCFHQDCAPELLDAVTALDSWLANQNNFGPNGQRLPAVVNISMGTHVGPHHGSSPLEDYISQTLTKSGERFLVAAAGNDGGRGFSACRKLKPNEQEFLHVRTGPRCKELLIEFWWDDAPVANMTIDVDVNEIQAGARNLLGSMTIRHGSGMLTTRTFGLPTTMAASSLCGATSGNMTCVAFALTSTSSTPLPPLEVAFSLEGARETIVRVWIVVAEIDAETAFLEGGQEGSLSVPACDPATVGVAGVMRNGQMWHGTSRGPAGSYQVNSPDKEAPLVAHRPDGVGSSATSIASPRTAADVAEVMVNATRRATCQTARDLVLETYYPSGRSSATLTWDSRFGYHEGADGLASSRQCASITLRISITCASAQLACPYRQRTCRRCRSHPHKSTPKTILKAR